MINGKFSFSLYVGSKTEYLFLSVLIVLAWRVQPAAKEQTIPFNAPQTSYGSKVNRRLIDLCTGCVLLRNNVN